MSANRRALRLALLRAAGKMNPPGTMPGEPRRILLIRPDNLGDLILAAAAPAAVRAAWPSSHVTAWLGPWGEPAWRHHPALDAIETCPFPGMMHGAKPNLLAPYLQAGREAGRLKGRFDLAINLRFDFWWGAMAASWAGIPVAGYDVPECQPFLAQAVPYHGGLHETEQNLRLIDAVAGRSLHTEPVELFPETELPRGLPEGAVAIHPGSGAEVKLWQDESWAVVADELAGDGPVVFTAGSPEEAAAAERIRAWMRHQATIVSDLDLPQLAAFYRRCTVVLGPDNGPLHVARHVGTPTVTLFGPTDPELFGPQDSSCHQVVRLPWRCIPCGRLDYKQTELAYHLCVKLIEPDEVLAAARRLLAKAPSTSG